MNKSDFYYDLPQELIAQTPIEPRDYSRLLAYNKATNAIEHKHFYDILDYLSANDVLVVNNTKVIPARLIGHTKFGGVVEVLLLKRLDYTTFETLVKPGKKFRTGAEIFFTDELSCTVVEHTDFGGRIVKFKFNGILEDILDRVGKMPLPPYIKAELEDQSRYQTVYAKDQNSAAAPTAGLHFTTELLGKIKAKGVQIFEVTLNVGLGTFRPVKEDQIENHVMHSEHFCITKEVADGINRAKAEGKRIISVGTTSVRVLESASDENGLLHEMIGDTNIFIFPPYRFKVVDALITNFHLPESTLIMLVSAFMGRENALNMYKTAVEERYRFFSFGDATFIY